MNMRAGLSTIQQTLTPDAATVLNHSISEASRRNHGQTTPLHVAATLLSSPSGFLRQACIRSHPNSSHPLQCRALELCFSVALERLPTAQNNPAAEPSAPAEPPISNALMAALKRAQAHQRRGCPEQQQQPLLAVKVELEQLVISILDDPSVSRVMREARFSSPAVKAAIEQSLIASTTQSHNQIPGRNVNFGSSFSPRTLSNSGQLSTPSPTPITQLTNRNPYLNPRLQQAAATGPIQNQRTEEVKKVLEIMGRCKKGNPILVGEYEPEAVVKEFLKKIESKELESDSNFKNIQVVSMEKGLLSSDKNHILAKMEELRVAVESRIKSGGVVLDLGDLKWLVEQQQKQATVISEMGRAAVAEMTKLVTRFGGGDNNRLWLIGTATCETYLRCQVYHSTMETDWDLQAVPIASRSPLPGMFPRMGANRILSNPMESLNPMKAVQSPLLGLKSCVSENLDPSAQKSTFCPKCSENYEKEVAKLSAIHKTFSEAADKPSLPQWLQNAKLNTSDAKTTDGSEGKDHGLLLPKQKTQELQKKWLDACLHLHPNFHQNSRSDRTGPPSLSMTSLYNPNMLSRLPFQSKLQTVKPIGEALQLNTNQLVRTDLVLGREGQQDSIIASEKADGGNCNQAKDLLSCISSEPNSKLLDKFSNALDADTYKKLLKGLMEKAWWQAEAASAVASAITRCRLGNGKRRGGGSRGDVWLLFTGPDRVGKKKMASVLAEQICGGRPVIICLGRKKRDDEELLDTSFRGKTAVDRIVEAVRRNPFLVIVLEDIDEADALVRGSIRRAIERGRITDSHGREVGLGNAVFVVTGDWSTVDREASRDDRFVDEDKLASVAGGSWQLGLIVREKMAKRRANWLVEDGPARRPRKETGPALSLDLNLSAGFVDEEKTEGSINSSELTIDHDGDDELDLVDRSFSITSVPHDLASSVDDSIVFKPVDSVFVRREIKKTISVKFAMVVDEDLPIEVGDDVVKKILGGLWHDRTSLEEWMENVVGPGFDQLKKRLPSVDRSKSVVRLVVESDSSDRGKSTGSEDWLPSSILV